MSRRTRAVAAALGLGATAALLAPIAIGAGPAGGGATSAAKEGSEGCGNDELVTCRFDIYFEPSAECKDDDYGVGRHACFINKGAGPRGFTESLKWMWEQKDAAVENTVFASPEGKTYQSAFEGISPSRASGDLRATKIQSDFWVKKFPTANYATNDEGKPAGDPGGPLRIIVDRCGYLASCGFRVHIFGEVQRTWPPPELCAAPTVTGTEGPDTLQGTKHRDVIAGLGGDDSINGLSGDDVICGGPGNDALSGGNGKDLMFGDDGDDSCAGGPDEDRATCERRRRV